MLSNWGVVLWTATATICLFSAVILKYQKASDGTVSFFMVSGIFSLILGFDDLYMVHDRLLPKLFHISEAFFYIIYIFSLLAYLIYFASRFLKYEYLLLLAALLFFVLSHQDVNLHQFVIPLENDDMLKYFGIVFWLAFFYRAALQEVNGYLNRTNETA